MSEKTYKNPFTLDGRLPYRNGLNDKKMEAMEGLVDSALKGSRIAVGNLSEALTTTSDGQRAFAQLVNATVLPELDDQIDKVGDQIATVRRVSDFRPNYLYTLNQSWGAGVVGDGQVNEPLDTLPTVPEGTVYPEAIFAGELIENSGIRKTGLRTGATWEALVNDTLGLVQAMPGAFRNLAVNTLERDVITTLVNASGLPTFAGGKSVDGTVVVPDAPISRAALAVAITQLKNQVKTAYNGIVNGGFNLIVAVGQGDLANFIINSLSLSEIADGPRTFSVNAGNPLSAITVIESIYVTSTTEWYLIPKKGTTQRPVLERLTLIGHEQAELRVNNLTGNYLGGSSVPPFEGSLDSDMIDWRVRLVTGSVLWSPQAVVHSDGTP